MSTFFKGDLTEFGLKATTPEDVAKEIAQKLRDVGIDVVDGLDPDEAVGRLPLSYFIHGYNSDCLVIGSRADRRIDYIEEATQLRYPDRYYLNCDNGEHLWREGGGYEWTNALAAKIRPSLPNTARVSLFGEEAGGSGRIVPIGDFVYDIGTDTLTYEKSAWAKPDEYPTLKAPYGSETSIYFHFSSGDTSEGSALNLGTGLTEKLNDFVRRAANYNKDTTGVELKTVGRSIYLEVPNLPSSRGLKTVEERMTIDPIRDQHWEEDSMGDVISVSPLTQEQMQEARSALREILEKKEASYGYWLKDVRTSFVMVMTTPFKGQRKPIGHIIMGATDGIHYEYCEFAIARTSANFEITDIYLRIKEKGKTEFRRCMGTSMREARDIIGDLKVIKTSLENAGNLKNPYAVNALQETEEMGGSAAIPASKLRAIASLRFGADLVERCYRMGYTTLADDICTDLTPTRAWDRITSMTDLFPGYTEGAKSIYTCFGMPKAWGKAVFDQCIEKMGTVFSLQEFRDSLLSIRMAWELEEALTEGKPSEMSVPDRALEYAEIWHSHLCRLGLGGGRKVVNLDQNFLFMAYPDKPIERAAALRAYNRMYKKVIKAAPQAGLYSTVLYLTETFQAYCQLKANNVVPEEHGVLYEYGLPEDNPKSVAEMIHRRCEAAQEVVKSYRAIIDKKKHQDQEAKYTNYRNGVKWLECADKNVSKDYVFRLPTKLYGDDDPLSLESEGAKQRNCVFGSYLNKLANGEYYIVCMRERGCPDDGLVTIGINRGYVVDQTYATMDKPITREQGEAIKRWVTKVSPRFGGKLKLAPHPAGWYR